VYLYFIYLNILRKNYPISPKTIILYFHLFKNYTLNLIICIIDNILYTDLNAYKFNQKKNQKYYKNTTTIDLISKWNIITNLQFFSRNFIKYCKYINKIYHKSLIFLLYIHLLLKHINKKKTWPTSSKSNIECLFISNHET
jgi:hypothetical protein